MVYDITNKYTELWFPSKTKSMYQKIMVYTEPQNILNKNNLHSNFEIIQFGSVNLNQLGFQYGSTQHLSSLTAFFQRSLNLFISTNDFILTSGLLSTSWDSCESFPRNKPNKHTYSTTHFCFKETYTNTKEEAPTVDFFRFVSFRAELEAVSTTPSVGRP